MARQDILVVVFLRGGCDGLNLVAPCADPIYIAERRPECRIEREGDHPGLPLQNTFADLDFRLHFKAGKLKELYDAKHLAIVHAAGLMNGTRSHFEAQDYMERGTPDTKNTSTGWLTRFAQAERFDGMTPVVAANNNLPGSLLGCGSAIAAPSARRIQLNGSGKFKAAQEALLRQHYQAQDAVGGNGRHTLGILDAFAVKQSRDAQGKIQDYTPLAGVAYPNEAGEFSNGLKSVAQIVKMDTGLRIATVDYGGWDTHVNQGGRFAYQADALARGLAAFWDDMKAFQDRLTVVVMSEFGRRLKSNDSGGTDHGHGNMMLVLGGHVKGGNIYGHWPGLENEHLDNQVDLAITTDFRVVLGEILSKRFQAKSLSAVFPKWTLPSSTLGIVA